LKSIFNKLQTDNIDIEDTILVSMIYLSSTVDRFSCYTWATIPKIDAFLARSYRLKTLLLQSVKITKTAFWVKSYFRTGVW